MTWLNPYCFAKHGHHPTPWLAVVRGVCWAIHLTVKLRRKVQNEKKRKVKVKVEKTRGRRRKVWISTGSARQTWGNSPSSAAYYMSSGLSRGCQKGTFSIRTLSRRNRFWNGIAVLHRMHGRGMHGAIRYRQVFIFTCSINMQRHDVQTYVPQSLDMLT